LYLPAGWFTSEYRERWQACRIPDGTSFRTKHELASELVEQAMVDGKLRGRWVVCDEGYGDDPATLDRFAATGRWYLAEVPRDTQVWPLVDTDGPTPRARPTRWVPPQKPSRKGVAPRRERLHPTSPAKVPLDQYAAQIPREQWQRFRVLEGSKGPLVADFAAVRVVVVRDKLPGPEVWAMFRRTIAEPGAEAEVKVYLSCAPVETPLTALVRVSGMRWPIEACFAEGNGELGMDRYELRFWRGWYHHMTMVILAHHFLVRLQRRLNQREGDHTADACPFVRRRAGDNAGLPGHTLDGRVPAATHWQRIQSCRSAHAPACCPPATNLRRSGRAVLPRLSAQTQSRRVSIAPKAYPPTTC
jgi:SRSO17 transposase